MWLILKVDFALVPQSANSSKIRSVCELILRSFAQKNPQFLLIFRSNSTVSKIKSFKKGFKNLSNKSFPTVLLSRYLIETNGQLGPNFRAGFPVEKQKAIRKMFMMIFECHCLLFLPSVTEIFVFTWHVYNISIQMTLGTIINHVDTIL